MNRVQRSAIIVLVGGLLMLAGLYLSYLISSALGMIVIGVPVFLYGIRMDLSSSGRGKHR